MKRFFKGKKPTDSTSVTNENATTSQVQPEAPPLGLKVLADGIEPTVDIVAVHGLNGHREKTWTAGNNVLWLRDLLPQRLNNARVFTWGYDANTHSASRVTAQYLYDHATTLVSDLALERQLSGTQERPIIFVAHSLGGIVVKSALIHSDSARANHLPHHRAIKASTYGVVFLGTPHQGSDQASWGKILASVASVFVHTNKDMLQHLERDSEWLQQQLGQFTAISGDFDTKFAYECYPTPIPFLPGKQIMVVPKSSAVVPGAVNAEPIAIMDNHLNMVKYASLDDAGFNKVAGHLFLMAKQANDLANGNQVTEGHRGQNSFVPLPSIQTGALMPALEDGPAYTVKACLDSLSFPERDNRLLSIPEPHPDTLQWVWDEQQEFKSWLNHGRGVFWLHGKPGCGKSTLMKYLSQTLQSKSKHAGEWTVFVHFYFNNQGSDLEKSMEGMLRSTLLQILQQAPSLFAQIQNVYRRFVREDLKWSLPALQQLLTSIFDASGHEQKFWLSIDALDECEGTLREHVAFLQNIAAEHQSTLWICISSRPLPTLVAQLGCHPNLILQNHTSTDISRFVEDKLRSAHVDMDADMIWLRDEIIEKANGVFLWVHLVVEEIFEGYEEGDTVSELRDRLSAIPSGLDQLFMRIWRMIDKRHTQEAIAMLNALVCAMRPLTLSEFRYALALRTKASFHSLRQLKSSEDLVRNDIEMTKRIRSRCGGLVEVSNNIVQFIHQSVKDWMQIMDVTNASDSDRRVDRIRNHQPLLQACLQYLLLPETLNLPVSAVRTQPFASYATYNWLDHYRKAEEDGSSQAEQLEEFLSPHKQYFQNWSRMYHVLKRTDRGTGLDISRRKSLPYRAGAPGPSYLDPIYPEPIVKINEPETTDLVFADSPPGTALRRTDRGSGLDISPRHPLPSNPGSPRPTFLEPPFPAPRVRSREPENTGLGLGEAPPKPHADWEIPPTNPSPTKPNDPDPTVIPFVPPPLPDDPPAEFPPSFNDASSTWSTDSDSAWTPFSFAAEHSLLNFLTLQIAHGVDVNLPGGEYGWPLQAAVVAGNLPIVRLLLDNGADIDAEGGRFGTAMAAAITLKRLEMIALLKRRGADVERCPPQSPYMVFYSSGLAEETIGSWAGYRSRAGVEGGRPLRGQGLLLAPLRREGGAEN